MANPDANRFPGDCVYCGDLVLAGEGVVSGKGQTGKWRTMHLECIPTAQWAVTVPNWQEVLRPWTVWQEYDL